MAARFAWRAAAIGRQYVQPTASMCHFVNPTVVGAAVRCGGASQQRMFATAAQVKELRGLTSAPLSDCKKALSAEGVNGDMQAAVDWLRKNGVKTAAKKASRAASEGCVGVAVDATGRSAALVEVNSETDFVGRNEEFSAFVERVAEAALSTASAEQDEGANLAALTGAALPGGDSTGAACTVAEGVTDMVAKFRENLVLRRVAKLDVQQGVIGSYVHSKLTQRTGKMAALVAVETDGDDSPGSEHRGEVEALSKMLAMHAVAARPNYLNKESVDSSAVEREAAILHEQAKASGKPENVIEKMVQGRLNKFYQEVALLEQACVVGEDNSKVAKVVATAAKGMGQKLQVTGLARYECGEGISDEEVPADDHDD